VCECIQNFGINLRKNLIRFHFKWLDNAYWLFLLNFYGETGMEKVIYEINVVGVEERRQNVVDRMRSSSELIFIIRKYKTIYNTQCMG
jgi:hypothetical protein